MPTPKRVKDGGKQGRRDKLLRALDDAARHYKDSNQKVRQAFFHGLLTGYAVALTLRSLRLMGFTPNGAPRVGASSRHVASEDERNRPVNVPKTARPGQRANWATAVGAARDFN